MLGLLVSGINDKISRTLVKELRESIAHWVDEYKSGEYMHLRPLVRLGSR